MLTQTVKRCNSYTFFQNLICILPRVLSVFILLISFTGVFAQVVNYGFNSSSATYSAITGGTLHGSTANDDDNFNAVNIGFTFNFNGANQTQVSINANGFMAFGASVSSSYTAISSGSSNQVISALNNDLQGQTGSELRSELIGTSPNRVFVIQWTNYRRYNTSGDNFNFQIRLNEADSSVQIRYGTMTTSGSSTYQVGLRGGTNADYNNRTSTTSWASSAAGTANNASMTFSTTVAPASGLTYTFTRPVPMVYTSSTTTQASTQSVSPGAVNQAILGVQVQMTGALTPLSLTNIVFNTSGSTNASNIASAKLFFTGLNATFGTTTQVGTTVASPNGSFSFTGSQVLAQGVNYFWLVYDISASAVLQDVVDATCTQLTVGGTPYTPTVTNPTGSRQILGPLSGPYTVGTGGNYTTLTAAVAALNNLGVSGAVTFNLTDATYSTNETFPIVINQFTGGSSINRVTIKPATGVDAVITGNAASLINLNGADFVTIDGSNNGTSTQNLSIINTSTGTSASVYLSSLGTGLGCRQVIVRNTIIRAGSPTATTFGIYAGGTTISTSATGNDHDTLVIINNNIARAQYGIYARSASTGTSDSVFIFRNVIGSDLNSDYIGRYGMDLQQLRRAWVVENTIRNIITASTNPVGIWVGAGFNNSVVANNSINNIVYTGTGGYGGKGITIDGTGATSNNVFANNEIYSISGDGWSMGSGSTDAIMGIRIVGTTGATSLYYNTVVLSGNANRASTTASAALYVSGTITNLELVNNNFNNSLVNATTATSKAYAIYSTVANTGFTASTNRNNYFASGTQGVLGFISAADQTTLTAWQTAMSTRDANSISANPLLNSTTILRPTASSPLLNAGAVVSNVTTDRLGISRSATTPTIGAYEQGGEFLPPSISFTALSNTPSPANRVVTAFATITDASGINTTSGTLPRLYYKKSTNANTFAGNTSADNGWKWVEATNTTSPFDFTIDYSLLTGGSVAQGEIIQYFVVAQDLATVPNVTVANATLASMPSSVNLNSTHFPATGTINSYSIAFQLSGTYLVGAGQTFTSLTNPGGFFEYVNNNVVAGDIVALITSNLTETGANALNQTSEFGGSNFRIAIQPSAPVVRTISGNFVGGLIRINGADRVSIDGRFNNTGNGNFLTIVNSATSGVTAGVQLTSLGNGQGANNNIIRNCTFSLTRTGPTSIGISVGGVLGNTGSDNDTLTILNNVIRSARFGIYVGGNASPNTTDMVVVENNTVGNDTLSFSGALLANINGISVKNNSFLNALSTTANNYVVQLSNVQNGTIEGNIIDNGQSTGGNVFGLILSGNDSNLVVSRNVVRNISYTGSSGYGGRGIDVNTTVPNSNISITNNIVNNIFGDGDSDIEAYGISGIMLRGATGNVKVQHNTVRLGGVISVGTYTSRSTAFYLGSSVGNIDVRNNIFANSIVKTNVTASETFAIINNATTNTNLSSIAYNNYAATGFQARVGYSSAANRVSINDWKSNVTADATSQSRVVNFVDTTASNLRLTGSSNGDFYLRCINLNNALTNADFDNVTRRPISYMGAFEASTPLTMSANAGVDTAVCIGSSVQIGGSSIVTGGVAPYTYAWSPTATAVSNPTVSPTVNTTYIVTVTDTFGFTARDTVFVTVNSAPNPPSASGPSTLCAGNTANLTATGTGTFEWFKNATGGAAIGTGNSYTTAVLNANDSFYVSVTNAQGCTSARTKVNVNVTSPLAPTATNATICSSNTASLSATGNGTLNWFRNATGGTSLATGANYTTGVLNANDSFFVQSTLNGCVSTRTQVNVTVNTTPVAPSVFTPAAICEGSSTQLIASPSAGTTQWFTSATGGTALASGDTLTTGSLSANATYYAGKTANGCLSTTRTLVSVIVNAIPALPSVAGATLCDGDSVTLTATGFATGDSVMWFDAATSGNKLADGSSYSTGALSASATYYVGIKSAAGCSNSSRSSAAVTVNPIPAAPQLADAAICEGSSANFDFSATNGTLRWYDDASATTPSFSGNVFNTGVLTDNDTFFVSVTQSGCESQRTQVAALVTKLAAVPSASNTKVCEGLPATLTANSGNADIYWYSTLTGGSPVDSGSAITVNGITATTIYYAESRNGACVTAERKPVVVVFYNKPDAAFTVQTQFMGGITFAPATPNGLAYNWNFGDGNSSTVVNPTHKYNANGNYNVKLVVVNPTSGCSDSTTQSVNVLSVGFADKQANGFHADVYPNPFGETAQITYTLTSAQDVSIRVVNLLGQEVMQLPAGLKQAGTHQVDFNGANLASGVYYVRLQVGATQHTLRVVKAN